MMWLARELCLRSTNPCSLHIPALAFSAYVRCMRSCICKSPSRFDRTFLKLSNWQVLPTHSFPTDRRTGLVENITHACMKSRWVDHLRRKRHAPSKLQQMEIAATNFMNPLGGTDPGRQVSTVGANVHEFVRWRISITSVTSMIYPVTSGELGS
jgi:hypothetical protein